MLYPSFFTNNRRALQRQLDLDELIVITAQSLLQRSGDTVYQFRQDSNFYYLTGIEEPDVVLVVCGVEEFLILPKRSKAEELFGGSIDCDEIAKISGVVTIYNHAEGWDRYKKLQKGRKKVYTLQAAPTKVVGVDAFFTNSARRALIQKLKRFTPGITTVDIRSELVRLRQLKQPEEVAMIQRAIDITKLGLDTVRPLITAGANEREFEAEINKVFTANGAPHAYQPIIAGGPRATTLHYGKNNQPLGKRELCLFDVGAEYGCYAADITRVYGRQMTERQRAVTDAVKRVQDEAIAYLKTGILWKDYGMYVEERMGETLVALGLLQKPTRESIRRYFGHGISHSLGLDVHDVCEYQTIEEHMVITVEPGIYIPEEGIGVRIEDDILITKDGAKNLSAHIAYD